MTTNYRTGMALLLITLAASTAFAQTAEEEAEKRLVVQMAKALRNDAAGQYEVARMYEKGVGTPRDLRLAHLWYTNSAKQGYGPAVQRLKTWDADIETMQRTEKQRAEQEERARQQSDAARQARERAAQEAKARQQAESEARAAREAARARQQAEAAAKAAAERAAQQEAAKRKQAAVAASPVATPIPAKPAPAPAVAAKPTAEADKAEFSANPCKGPSAKFMSTCK